MRVTFFILTLCFTILLTCNNTAYAGKAPEQRWQSFDQAVEQRLKYFSVPSAAIAVVDNGRLVMTKCYGERNIGAHLPVTEQTNFQLASISKFLFALTTAILNDERIIDWNTPVISYYPALQLSSNYIRAHVTLADLLSHRSGLQQFDGDDLVSFGYSYNEILARTQYIGLSNFRKKAQYSNVGYLIASAAVTGATKTGWQQSVTGKLFLPLNMTGSYCESTGADFLAQHPDYALPYTFDFETGKLSEYSQRTDYTALGPAGAMSSNIADMSNLLLMLANNGTFENKVIITPAALNNVYSPWISNNAGGPQRLPHGFNGLGCNGYSFDGVKVVEKDGLLNGTAPVICLVPSTNSGIVILCNTDMIDFRCCVRELFLEYILGQNHTSLQQSYFDSWKEECAQHPGVSEPQPVPAPALQLSEYCGKYGNSCYGNFNLKLNGNRIEVTAEHNNSNGWLIPRGGNDFIWYWPKNDDEFAMKFIVTNGTVNAARGEWLGVLKKYN